MFQYRLASIIEARKNIKITISPHPQLNTSLCVENVRSPANWIACRLGARFVWTMDWRHDGLSLCSLRGRGYGRNSQVWPQYTSSVTETK